MAIKSVAVYLGSKIGNSDVFIKTAYEVGRQLALNDIVVVYGGTNVGTMNALANGVLEAGGDITGVIPERFRSIDFTHKGLTKLIKVEGIQERKQIMEDLSHAAVILPGSYGTMDELFEYAVNNQLKQLNRPILVLNLKGFYAPLKEQLDIMEQHGMLLPELKAMFYFCDTIENLINTLKLY